MPQKFNDGEQVRVNVRCNVDAKSVRKEKRDGRDVIVVPSYTLPDNIVMNGIMYPAEEIEKGYKSLEGTPAPLGHPTVNDMFVPARSPLGLNLGYFGAWNANVSRDDGRVFIEKIIDVERANESKMGKRVLEALDKREPIHTSTGLLMHIRECQNSDLADWEGYDMEFDHDAILLDETGAATPSQGVGMMVNNNKVKVVNCCYSLDVDDQIDMLGMELLSAMDRKEDASRWAQIKEAILEAFGLANGEPKSGPEPTEATNMAGEKELETRLESLEQTLTSISTTLNEINTTSKAHSEMLDALNAEKDAERDVLVKKVVEAEILDEDTAKATPMNALRKLVEAPEGKPKPAPGISANFKSGEGDYSLAEEWEA